MTNEELAVAIRNGRTELTSQLWENVRRFVHSRARETGISVEEKAQGTIKQRNRGERFAHPCSITARMTVLTHRVPPIPSLCRAEVFHIGETKLLSR